MSSTARYNGGARNVEQKTPGDFELEAWAARRRVLDIIEAAKVDGDPRAILTAIEEDLRAGWRRLCSFQRPARPVRNQLLRF